MVAEDSNLKPHAPLLSRRPSVSKYTPNLLIVPEEPGKSAARMARRAKQVIFFRACVETHGPHELNYSPKEAHVEAHILNYMSEH